jgi:hypothetical protein
MQVFLKSNWLKPIFYSFLGLFENLTVRSVLKQNHAHIYMNMLKRCKKATAIQGRAQVLKRTTNEQRLDGTQAQWQMDLDWGGVYYWSFQSLSKKKFRTYNFSVTLELMYRNLLNFS